MFVYVVVCTRRTTLSTRGGGGTLRAREGKVFFENTPRSPNTTDIQNAGQFELNSSIFSFFENNTLDCHLRVRFVCRKQQQHNFFYPFCGAFDGRGTSNRVPFLALITLLAMDVGTITVGVPLAAAAVVSSSAALPPPWTDISFLFFGEGECVVRSNCC
jgi:hypothetical protein